MLQIGKYDTWTTLGWTASKKQEATNFLNTPKSPLKALDPYVSGKGNTILSLEVSCENYPTAATDLINLVTAHDTIDIYDPEFPLHNNEKLLTSVLLQDSFKTKYIQDTLGTLSFDVIVMPSSTGYKEVEGDLSINGVHLGYFVDVSTSLGYASVQPELADNGLLAPYRGNPQDTTLDITISTTNFPSAVESLEYLFYASNIWVITSDVQPLVKTMTTVRCIPQAYSASCDWQGLGTITLKCIKSTKTGLMPYVGLHPNVGLHPY
jgi:hypothetical protein